MVDKLTKIDQTYQSIKAVLETARNTAYRAVNFTMVQAYWHIGRLIVEEEQKGKQRAEYGKYLIKEISERLTRDFGEGFTERNLRNFRRFYFMFPIRNALRTKSEKLPTSDALRHQSLDQITDIRPELTWTHYRLLLRVEKEDIRKFYLEECKCRQINP